MSSVAQRDIALKHANTVRLALAAVKRQLRFGQITFEEALMCPFVDREKVWRLLMACPGIKEVKAGKIMQRMMIGPGRRVGGLTGRQREELTELVALMGPEL